MPLGKTPRTEISPIVEALYKFEVVFNSDEATHPCISRISEAGFILICSYEQLVALCDVIIQERLCRLLYQLSNLDHTPKAPSPEDPSSTESLPPQYLQTGMGQTPKDHQILRQQALEVRPASVLPRTVMNPYFLISQSYKMN